MNIMNTFNKEKYFRVVYKKDALGRQIYEVQSCANFIELLFGLWLPYEKENKSINEAVEQIQTISGYKTVLEKVVYKIKL